MYWTVEIRLSLKALISTFVTTSIPFLGLLSNYTRDCFPSGIPNVLYLEYP
jgi:hypothetical protein